MALRPGALCTLLGACPAAAPGCGVSDPSRPPSAAPPPPPAPLDRCSSTGVAGGPLPPGTAPPGAAPPPPLCRDTSDCRAANFTGGAENFTVCVYSGDDCAFRTCTPATGADVCESTGRCGDPCNAPAVQARLEASRRAAPPCGSAAGGAPARARSRVQATSGRGGGRARALATSLMCSASVTAGGDAPHPGLLPPRPPPRPAPPRPRRLPARRRVPPRAARLPPRRVRRRRGGRGAVREHLLAEDRRHGRRRH